MPLSNAQYDEIMRGYNKRQLKAYEDAANRKKKIYDQIPRLRELDRLIASTSVSRAKSYINGDARALCGLEKDIANFSREKADILSGLGLPPDYFDPIYTCPECQDTGYIRGQKCHCLRQAEADYIYSQSNIKEVLAKDNFDTFTYQYYSDKMIDPQSGLSARKLAEAAVAKCQHFISSFKEQPSNLILYGNTGTGKTFLTNCVARELLNAGCSVIYFSAFQLFDILAKHVFDKTKSSNDYRNIYECDLLIIDDLGTEVPNALTISQFFQCLNERILRNRSTIISTNLELGNIADIYSERISSRITNSFTPIRLFGDDIRIMKKLLEL